MGLFGSDKSGDSGQGRSSAEGGNGNVKNPRGTHNHEALATVNLQAVRNLHHGDASYEGKHRAN